MGNSKMGQRDGFSAMDVEKLNQMYDCGYHSASVSVPAPVPVIPAPIPAPVPVPPSVIGTGSAGNTAAIDNMLISSFINGIMTGLGFGDDPTA